MPENKAQLLARMAVARALVWRGLSGLPQDLLVKQPVADAWTAKDTLAHLAFWDAFRAEQLEMMLNGHIDAIDWTDADTINARVYAERSAWSLEQAIAEAQSARARFLALIDPMTDSDLDRSFTISPSNTITVRGWIERRPRHDQMHLAPIDQWRERAKPDDAPGPKSVLVAALEAGRAALLATGDLIPVAERSSRPVYGVWTWQDVIGHVTDWEIYCVEGLRSLATGKPVEYDPDVEQWNRLHAAERYGEPFEKTWEDFVQARRDLLDLLDGFDDTRLAQPANAPVAFLSHYYFWFSDCASHDVEHAEGLAAALDVA